MPKMGMRDVLQVFGFICLVMLGFEQSAHAQEASLAKLLMANRYQLAVQNGAFSGPGAAFLKSELSEAQFVAIGEEHGTREVPQFVWATCRAMGQDGLDAMAVEAGPLVTEQLALWTARGDGDTSLSAFEKQYPDSIAFLIGDRSSTCFLIASKQLPRIRFTCGVCIRSSWARQGTFCRRC
jgi:hypothetical protein